jgi:hypothetical protein
LITEADLMSEAVLAARRLGRDYVRDQFRVAALRDVDLNIDKGQFAAMRTSVPGLSG